MAKSVVGHSFSGKRVDVVKLAGEIEAACGIKVMATLPTDTVHGHITAIEHLDGTHEVEVVLYEEHEPARSKDSHPLLHESTLAPHGLDAAGLARLRAVCEAHRA